MDAAVIHIENQRDDHVAIARKAQHAVEFLPVRHIEAAVVETGMKGVIGILSRPGGDERRPGWPGHHGFAKECHCLAPCDGHAKPIDFQAMKAIDTVFNDVVVAPAHQPISSRSVEEVVLASSLPDEVPGIIRVGAKYSALVRLDGLEGSLRSSLEVALLVCDGVLVLGRFRRHKADAERAAIGRITEAFNLAAMGAVEGLEHAG